MRQTVLGLLLRAVTRIFLPLAVAVAVLPGQTVQYSYDAAGRLIRADYGNAGAIDYTYDNAGNLTSRTVASGDAQFTSLSSASFNLDGVLAPEAIATGFGAGLASDIAVAAAVPLPTELLGTSVDVTDSAGTTRRAELISVTPTQISYIVPPETTLGLATVQVNSGAGGVVNGTLRVEAVAPGIYTATQQGAGVFAGFALRIAADGTQSRVLTFDPATNAPVPIAPPAAGEQVFLELFGTGMRGVSQGAAATVGGVSVPVLGPVAQPQFAGLDQANLGPVTAELAGRGEVSVILTVDGKAANTVTVTFQ